MLRHLKRRQQELETQSQRGDSPCSTPSESGPNKAMPLANSDEHASNKIRQQQQAVAGAKQQKRVRGRRSSKPAMEKRRRARINECLNILKSYVLNDSSNLNRLGIDSGANENQIDEETVACHILKTSGLINRHRGRKNPNKLEKADILELTVDYVRRLHEQRNEILLAGQQQANPMAINMTTHPRQKPATVSGSYQQQVVPAHLSEPLTLDLSPKSRQFGPINTNSTPPMLQAYIPPPNTPITPPSSASSLQGPADVADSNFHNQQQHHLTQMQLLSQVLDGHYKLYPDWVNLSQIKDQ